MENDAVSRITSRQGAEDHLLCWGCSEFGQHGHSRRENIHGYESWLKRFSGPPEKCVKYLGCGASHTVVVTKENEVYAWGNGHCGQVGCGDEDSHNEPLCIKLYANQLQPPQIKGVACGSRHTVILLKNGHMFSFGNNQYAQLGYDPRIKDFRENQARPHLLRTFTHLVVDQVACGEKHTLFLLQYGTVGAVGNNCYGQLGCGDCAEATTMQKIESLSKVKAIACGANHSLAVDDYGSLYCWGFGKACGSKDDNYHYPERKYVGSCKFVSVSGGAFHSVARSVTNNVFSWGSNSDGQLGHGEKIRFQSTPSKVLDNRLVHKVAFVACGDLYTTVITVDGSLYMWGKSSYVIEQGRQPAEKIWQPKQVNIGGYPVKQIACGSWHVAALTGKPETSDVVMNGGTVGIFVEEVDVSDKEDSETDDEGTTKKYSSAVRPTLGERQPTIPIGDFYAPTPEPCRNGFIPSPDLQIHFETPRDDLRKISNVSSLAQTARSDSSDPDFQPIAVYFKEHHKKGHANEDGLCAVKDFNNNRLEYPRNIQSRRGRSAEREKQSVKLSNSEVMPELSSRFEQSNCEKVIKDHTLPGRPVPRAQPFGLYRSKTLNPIVARKGPSKGILNNIQFDRDVTFVSNKSLGFVSPEDLKPTPKVPTHNDIWIPVDDGVNSQQYRMKPTWNPNSYNKRMAEKLSNRRRVSESSSLRPNPFHHQLNSAQHKQHGMNTIFPKPMFHPATYLTRSKTYIAPEKTMKQTRERQHTSLMDLTLCAERMNINSAFPFKPILKDSRKLHSQEVSPQHIRSKPFLASGYDSHNVKGSPPQHESVFKKSPVLSAPTKRSPLGYS